MLTPTKQLLYWSPRILGIMFALFISLFALDVFSEGEPVFKAVAGFLIHLIPTYLIIIALILAWKWERSGGIVFIGLGLVYIVMAWGRENIYAFLFISGPLIIVGILFLLNWLFMQKR